MSLVDLSSQSLRPPRILVRRTSPSMTCCPWCARCMQFQYPSRAPKIALLASPSLIGASPARGRQRFDGLASAGGNPLPSARKSGGFHVARSSSLLCARLLGNDTQRIATTTLARASYVSAQPWHADSELTEKHHYIIGWTRGDSRKLSSARRRPSSCGTGYGRRARSSTPSGGCALGSEASCQKRNDSKKRPISGWLPGDPSVIPVTR